MGTKDASLNGMDGIPALSGGDGWEEVIFKRPHGTGSGTQLVLNKCELPSLDFPCQSIHSSCPNLKMMASLLISLSLSFLTGLLRVLWRLSDVSSCSKTLKIFGSFSSSLRAQRRGLLKGISLETITWILSLKSSFIIVVELALYHQPDPNIKLVRDILLPHPT